LHAKQNAALLSAWALARTKSCHVRKGCKVVGRNWEFRIKRGLNSEGQSPRTVVVAQDFTQIEETDYEETFAPVAKFTSLRAVLALATKEDLEV
jgi:hypothetical protein